jgi:hypothetical protein
MVGMAAGGESGWVRWLGDDIPPPDFLKKKIKNFIDSLIITG